MKNKVVLSLLAAAAVLTSCAGPSSPSGDRTAAPPTTAAPAPVDPGGRWLGGDADRDWGAGGGARGATDASGAAHADGGGDTPEDLNAGLHEAVTSPSWRGDDAVKLAFLIADAPPHLDYQGGPDYAADVRAAARRGIKIMPIASSGLDDQGEHVFRQLAQITMGRFTFLTYGADGASPGDQAGHHVSDYAVLALDDLVVRLVSDELRPLSAGGQ